jgi:hypothetical protein
MIPQSAGGGLDPLAVTARHDRPWRPEVAVMPRAFIDGDRVRLTGVRDFQYRTRDDFTVRYEEREVSLSHLAGIDFYALGDQC